MQVIHLIFVPSIVRVSISPQKTDLNTWKPLLATYIVYQHMYLLYMEDYNTLNLWVKANYLNIVPKKVQNKKKTEIVGGLTSSWVHYPLFVYVASTGMYHLCTTTLARLLFVSVPSMQCKKSKPDVDYNKDILGISDDLHSSHKGTNTAWTGQLDEHIVGFCTFLDSLIDSYWHSFGSRTIRRMKLNESIPYSFSTTLVH